MTRRLQVVVVVVGILAVTGCGGCKKSPGPLADTRPADLGPTGLVIEQPRTGETIVGQWVAVSGWFDPARYQGVAIIGAPVDGFYATSGHVGVPSVPVLKSKEGRFIAPRVPLAEGATSVKVLPIAIDNTPLDAIALELTGQGVDSVPAIINATPTDGLVPLDVTFQARAASDAPGWQWDFDADGVFDEEGASVKHTFALPGAQRVLARTRLDGRWVYAVTRINPTEEHPATHQASIGANARLLTVTSPRNQADTLVLLVDDEGVHAFDITLTPRFSLQPTSEVRGLSGDLDGKVYVASATEVRRYGTDGTPDLSFADAGVRGGFTSLRGLCVERDGYWELVDDGKLEECIEGRCDVRGEDLSTPSALRCAAEERRRVGVVTTADGRRWVPGPGADFQRIAKSGWRDLIQIDPLNVFAYAIGVRDDGTLGEWFLSDDPVRTVKLPWAAETVAIDQYATSQLSQKPRKPRLDVVPVIFVAGQGRLERRELDGHRRGLW